MKFTLPHISLVNRLFLVPIQHISITDIPFCLSSLSCLLMFATALLAYAISCISACSILSHDPWHCINGTCLCILLHPWSPGSCYTAYALCISDSHFCHTCASNNICWWQENFPLLLPTLLVTLLIFLPSVFIAWRECIHLLPLPKSISYFLLSCSFFPVLATLLTSFQLFACLPSPLPTAVMHIIWLRRW